MFNTFFIIFQTMAIISSYKPIDNQRKKHQNISKNTFYYAKVETATKKTIINFLKRNNAPRNIEKYC